ncbi:hypothetical protein BSKO_06806 [Bryopsis sp. KO-2023]|nr:hypothetical protein BSKO_06806 [Bryopsis sp. KO-2023]
MTFYSANSVVRSHPVGIVAGASYSSRPIISQGRCHRLSSQISWGGRRKDALRRSASKLNLRVPERCEFERGGHKKTLDVIRDVMADAAKKIVALTLASTFCLSVALTSPAPASAGVLPVTGDPLSELSSEERSVVGVFQDNTPSVVNITNVAAMRDRFSLDVTKIPRGTGSGFIWDDNGHVVTNFHVIKGASELRVTLLDQSVYTATLIAGDEDKDVAVLSIDCPSQVARKLRPVNLGSSATLLVGQKVFAIGNPFGLDHTLTQGIISGLGRELNAGVIPIKGVIQTDAAINPGNSGGVLLNSKGRLIGINTAILDPTGKGISSGVGFAIPIDTVKGLVEQILKYGRIIRPFLGVTIAPPQVLLKLNLKGVLILEVLPDSPAANGGLRATRKDMISGAYQLGDIIVGIDGVAIRNYKELFEVLDGKKVGQTVKVQVIRDDRIEDLNVKLAESRPARTDN